MKKTVPRQKLSPDDLQQIVQKTLGHYNENPEGFWTGTCDHDVSQNYQAFLEALPKDAALDILDLGCGPGRDVGYFKSLGHRAVGLDGSSAFCEMARDHTGCSILEQDFLNLCLQEASFDGIFANACLFHVPSQELVRVLNDLHQALRPDGVLFSSNPRGDSEGWNGVRYGHFMELDSYESFLKEAQFRVVKHYYRPPGKPRDQQPWLAVVSQRLES